MTAGSDSEPPGSLPAPSRAVWGPWAWPAYSLGCGESEARRVQAIAISAYEEARALRWPFLSDVLERALRDVSEDDRGDRAAIAAVVHALVKYDRLLAFATDSGDALARFEALLPLARGEVAALAERVERLASPVERLGVAFSFPSWLVELIGAELGLDAVPAALARMNELAPRVARVNTLKTTRDQCVRALEEEGVAAAPALVGPDAMHLSGSRSPFRTQAFARGELEMQDEASQLVANVVAPPPGSLVVDACAGAGGKALALAALLRGKGRLVALDVSQDKLAELRRRARRAGATNVRAIELDLLEAGGRASELEGRAARVLLDAPCTGLGAIRRNPEARWRLAPADVPRLVETQAALLRSAARLVAPHGRLIFATCSFLPSEGEAQVERFVAEVPGFARVTVRDVLGRAASQRIATTDGAYLRTWRFDPSGDGGADGMDGFFGAVLRRERAPVV